MNRETISLAIGNMDDRHIQEAESERPQTALFARLRHSRKKMIALAASIALLFTLAVPALAAADIPAAYEVMYALSPEMAQRLKPVSMSNEDEGIRMEVISANISGKTADIFISMQDLTGERIDETIDLFDSYHIRVPFSSSATCERKSYDEKTGVATFLIHIELMGNRAFSGRKITFSVNQFLSNKQEYHDTLPQIDWHTVSRTPQTQHDVNSRGGYGDNDPAHLAFLAVQPETSFSPADGVTVTGTGFLDGKLHMQAYYENILETDNHGYLYLLHADGSKMLGESVVAFWDSARTGSYEEYVFDISPEELMNYAPYGHFWTCSSLTTGNWEVTFPLE